MELLGLLLAPEVQRGILVDQLVQRDGDLVLVALGLGLDGVGDRGLRHDEPRQNDRMVLGRERVARRGLLELRDGDDVARPGLGHVDVLLALGQEEPGEALGDPARRVPVVAVRLEVAAAHAQVRDAAGERVGDRLEDLCDRRVLLVAEDLRRACRPCRCLRRCDPSGDGNSATQASRTRSDTDRRGPRTSRARERPCGSRSPSAGRGAGPRARACPGRRISP